MTVGELRRQSLTDDRLAQMAADDTILIEG
jgi:hypothetical protein